MDERVNELTHGGMNEGGMPEAVKGFTQPAGVTSGGRGSREQPEETTSRQRLPLKPRSSAALPGVRAGAARVWIWAPGQMERRATPRVCNPRNTSCRGCPRMGVPQVAKERVRPGHASPPQQDVSVNSRGFANAASRPCVEPRATRATLKPRKPSWGSGVSLVYPWVSGLHKTPGVL